MVLLVLIYACPLIHVSPNSPLIHRWALTKAPETWNQFQSSLWGAGLNATQRGALWSTYKAVGGQAVGSVMRPVVGSAYTGVSELIVTGGNVVTKASLGSGGLGFWVGVQGVPTPPELPSGNPILFPYEMGQFFGGAVSNTADIVPNLLYK